MEDSRWDGKVGQVAKVTRLLVVLVCRNIRTTGLVYTGCVLADKVDGQGGLRCEVGQQTFEPASANKYPRTW